MSGVELIVGVVLGGVPIVLEAFDRYAVIYESFKTFRRPTSELRKLTTTLNVQKAIFRSTVFSLLKKVTNDEETSQRLLSGERSIDLNRAPQLERDQISCLRDLFNGWKEMLALINLTLGSICMEMKLISDSLAESGKVGPDTPHPIHHWLDSIELTLRKTYDQIKARIRLSWGKRTFQKSLEELKSSMTDFQVLTNSITKSLTEMLESVPERSTQKAPEQSNNIEKYQRIREASQRLYAVLSHKWTCARHQKHTAVITLSEGEADKANSSRFEIVINSEEEPSKDSMIWLDIESDLALAGTADITQQERSWDDFELLRKFAQPMSWESTKKNDGKLLAAPQNTVTSRRASPSRCDSGVDLRNPEQAGASSTQHKSTTCSIELNLVDDLCRHLEESCSASDSGCLGFIRDVGFHHFWRHAPQPVSQNSQMTLAELISWISADQYSRTMSRANTTRIAGSLAGAVLQYHSTPWLPEAWQSSHVLFLGVDTQKDEVTAPSPYFRAEIPKFQITSGEDDGRHTTGNSSPTSSTSRAPTAVASSDPEITGIAISGSVRNTLLFCLGVVLLELGYNKSWSLLSADVAESANSAARQSDYLLADILATRPLLRRNMGPKYVNIVRKCLGCDFGLGENDFKNENLQERFLEEVIVGLKSIERVVMKV